MESNQFETLMLAITGLRSEFNHLETKMDIGFAEVRKEMSTGFAEVRKDLKVIREQVAQTHVDVTDLNRRVTDLERPRA